MRERKTKQTTISLEPARLEKLRELAAAMGVSPNEVVGRIIDAAEVVKPALPFKVELQATKK